MCLPVHQIRRVCQEQYLVMGMLCDQDTRLDVALAQTAASNAQMKTEIQIGVSPSLTGNADLKCLFVSGFGSGGLSVVLNPDLSPERR